MIYHDEHLILDDLLPSYHLICNAEISMPFLYVYVCDVLEKLGELVYRDCPLLVGFKEKTNTIAVKWLSQHRCRLNEFSVDSQAVIGMLYPEQRTDRGYGLDAERLEQLIARVLNLPRNLHSELQVWRNGLAHGDLGACVERVMDKMTWVSRFIACHVLISSSTQSISHIILHIKCLIGSRNKSHCKQSNRRRYRSSLT